jgi:hypothetical protein
MPRLAIEPLLFCICWVGLAVALGLLLVLMPMSAFILTRYDDEKLERQIRWGILVIAGLLFAVWLKS